MTEWYVYRAPATGDPGAPLGRVRAHDRMTALEDAALRWPDLIVTVSPVSADIRALEKATRRALRHVPRVRYLPTQEREP